MSSAPPPGFGQGLVEGAAKGAYEMGKGIVDLARTSASGWQQLGDMAKDLATSEEARDSAMQAVKQLAAQAKQAATDYAKDPQQAIQDAKDGANALANAAQAKAQELLAEGKQAYADAAAKGEEARFIGQAVGRTAFEVASLLVGAGEAAKAGELAKLSKAERAMGKVGSEVLPCGKLAKAEAAAAKAAPEIAPKLGKVVEAAAEATPESRKALARKFYEDVVKHDGRKMSPAEIDSHLRGIDFTKDVEIVEIAEGKLGQWQVPGGRKGNYFAGPEATPGDLGISHLGDTIEGTVAKVRSEYAVEAPVKALRSTAAPIVDDWSSKYAAAQTKGGGTQYFIPENAKMVGK